MSTTPSPALTYNMADLWEALAAAGPDDECLVAGDVRHTRRTLEEAANRVAHVLVDRGVAPGERVGIYSRNRAEYVEALLGCWKAGAAPVNVNWRYVAEELRYVFADAELVAVVAEREYVPLLEELAPSFPEIHTYLIIDDPDPSSAEAPGAAAPSASAAGSSAAPTSLETASWSDLLAAAPATRLPDVPRSSDDVYMLYTGGTTGMPKGVMWRHEDFFFACVMGGNVLEPITSPAQIVANARPDFRVDAVILGPLMHGGGQWLTLIALYTGSKAIVYCERSFDAVGVLDLVDAEHPTTIGVIGDAMARPIAEAVLAEPDRWDVSSLVSIGNGGAMLSGAVKDQLRAAFPAAMLNDSYGASETGAAGREIDDGSAGDQPRFTVDENTKVLDADTLEPLAPGSGATGLFAKTGHIPLGYWHDEAKTAATFRVDRHGKRWVVPGDFAQVDAQGRIVLLGRGSGCINTGGEKVYPEEVEAAIRRHPDVFDAVVVGVPDERYGAKVVALVALRETRGAGADGDPLTLEALQEHCRAHIAGYKVPRALIVGDAPRTNVGKPDYKAAAAIATEHFGTASTS